MPILTTNDLPSLLTRAFNPSGKEKESSRLRFIEEDRKLAEAKAAADRIRARLREKSPSLSPLDDKRKGISKSL